MEVTLTDLIQTDIDHLLNDYTKYGFKSRDEMIVEAVQQWRLNKRIETTKDLPFNGLNHGQTAQRTIQEESG